MSPEHHVSLKSATEVLRHLDPEQWQGWPVLLHRGETRWSIPGAPLERRTDDPFNPAGWTRVESGRPGAVLALLQDRGVEVAWPALHGPFGEDGTVQGMLALHGLPFVGSDTAASAVAIDKLRTWQALTARGLPMAKAHLGAKPLDRLVPSEAAAEAVEAVGLPCFLKIATSGSTLGVSRATSMAEVEDFLSEHGGRSQGWLAEAEVIGEEISVPVLEAQDGMPMALPPVGIYPKDDGWFTHDAKYRTGGFDESIPPRGLSRAQIQQVQELAVACHEALGCAGLSRTDMIVTSDGPVILELNSLPGMTPESLLPKAAAAAGIGFQQLLSQLLCRSLDVAAESRPGGERTVALPRPGSPRATRTSPEQEEPLHEEVAVPVHPPADVRPPGSEGAESC